MSFILDALRKSETQRQRQAGPGIAEAGYRPAAPRRGAWLPILVLILAANLLLLAAFWWRNGHQATAATADANAVPADLVAAIPQPHVVRPASAARAAGSEESSAAPLPDLASDLSPTAPRTEVLEPPPVSLTATSSPAEPMPPAGFATGELPSADQLTTAGVLTGPSLHLDLHVYSTRAAERFVFINNRKYAEGTEVQDGVRIEQITPDGVVLSKNGTRFNLPRE